MQNQSHPAPAETVTSLIALNTVSNAMQRTSDVQAVLILAQCWVDLWYDLTTGLAVNTRQSQTVRT